jgi:hypothetical protein
MLKSLWFTLNLLLIFSGYAIAQPKVDTKPPAPDSAQATRFGYRTVQAALSALQTKSEARISDEQGWTIVDDKLDYTVWSFTPSTHPAYPAGIKQVITQDAKGDIRVIMTALCQAQKAACDKLVEEFRGRNEQMAERVRARLRGQ